ncbi:DNA polymerase III subunit beta [Ktedonospora formicarum]|uniref:Beta sliding clamp n=1 Tax=Ktedonospora formicarum TaxID=2778364 RepID=A0A8J3I4F6_9CHLR|nr:DNA polymerase III subunit beta [Ktedonospora formicarum]GHO44634.1 DNA polymerase III subunit beta [Ktedonospora formicarum]
MKITCKQQDLSRGLSVVSHAVSSRSTLPILANILLTTDQGRLKLSATNLEIGINCWIDAEVQEEGSTTVPAKTISDLVGSLRPIQVELSVTDESHTINVKSQGTNATIKGMDPSEFPLIPSTEGSETPIALDAKQLKEMITYVAFSAADDDARPVLTGVHVETSNEQLVFAAADAFRLAVMSIPLPAGEALADTILIPARTLTELARILPNEGTVQMIVTPNRSQVLFHTENVDMVSRLIEGTFPNFRGIIPKGHTTRAVIETKEFAAAVKTVTPFARDSSNIARIKISSGSEDGQEPGTLTIEANAEDIGSNVSTINAAVDGPEQEIIFNVRYLSDVLGVLTTPEVALEVISAARPGALKPVGAADYTYIIMPMSTNR